METSASICVYPLSSPYLPLHRYLYYTSLIISLLYPTPPPLVKGAFAYSLTYASTAAVYTFAIAGVHSPKQIVNLDLFGLWAVLSSASIAVLPFLQWNKNLQNGANRGGRSIVRIWGVLVIAASICIYVLLLRSKGSIEQYSDKCQQAIAEAQREKLLLRNPMDIIEADYARTFGTMYGWITHRIAALVFIPAAFGLLSCAVTAIKTTPVHDQEEESWDHLTAASAGKLSIFSAMRYGFVQLRDLTVCLTPLLVISTIVINELYLLRGSGAPEGEQIYEVGQWGIFVGAGLVGAAATVNAAVGQPNRQGDDIIIGGCGCVESGMTPR